MTLTTTAYVTTSADAEFVLAETVQLAIEVDGYHKVSFGSVVWDIEDGAKTGTRVDQGLPAWFFGLKSGAPLRDDVEPRWIKGEGEWAADSDDESPDPPCDVEFRMDTAYSYRSASGLMCSGLHAITLLHLLAALPEGSRVQMRNEYSDVVGDITDEAFFRDFAGAGVAADKWFHEAAMPAIARSMGAL